ncbi:hypothetical protein CGRA01v4_00125 [Colletotrichum graminicola]|uniref:Wax synthase domain-containing protein n=1 Tax=Colletotrichum graminicola (strain M1.001 / M2 / FGSC 10212) TaxID=645133 RepID=E3QUB0_COLGM|nr:uncharacterized protein GLRG_09592 [Colletotrichum graminicola M1.001]EFQ34448.1 hypothetical protein GLRG_09592 [Colletotrichum graminicola M1.001]WDK08847.1 hypothetical protein CGRA01v4_00125 [Colletotrichum graminicola]
MEFMQSIDTLGANSSMEMPLGEMLNWSDFGFAEYSDFHPHGNYRRMDWIETLYTFFIWETWVSIQNMASKELLYPAFLYTLSVACIAIALNTKERYRGAWVAASVAIGYVILQCLSPMSLEYVVKDTLIRVVIIHNMGAVVMILWEKFCLTEEQKKLSWGKRAIATYKIMWNSRFVKTSRPAPVFHLLKADEELRKAALGATVEEEDSEELDEHAAGLAGNTDDNYSDGLLHIKSACNGVRQIGYWIWSCIGLPVVRLWNWIGHRNRWIVKTTATILIVWVLDRANDHVQIFIGFEWDDIQIDRTVFFRRLNEVTLHEVMVRCVFAVQSIWSPYAFYTEVHSIMAIFFVALRIDEPEDWPPVFGDIRQAWSLRRLWSKFWDRLIYRPVNGLGEMFMTAVGLGQRPFRGQKRWLLNGLVFFISGIFHAGTDYISGIHCAWMWEIWWWNMNFVVIAGETALLYFIRAYFPRFYEKMSGKVGKTIGFLWVFAWFFWSAPKQHFRAMHCIPPY